MDISYIGSEELSEGVLCETSAERESETDGPEGIVIESSGNDSGDSKLQGTSTRSSAGGPIPDGIYAFKNLGNTDRWMDIQYNSTLPDRYVQQYAYGTSPADGTSNFGLYKVTQIGNTGNYTIRLMINENLSFQFVDNYVKTVTIPAADADVPLANTFTFTYSSGGYLIKPYGSTYCVSANNTTASGSSGAPDSYLAKKTLAAAGNCARWIVEGKSTDIPDGVYALRNAGNANRWMDIQYNSYQPGAYVQQTAYSQSPTANSTMANSSRGALFKISRPYDFEGYVIRLMTNNELSPHFSMPNVKTKKIHKNDRLVDLYDKFDIIFYNGAYIIRNCETSNIISANVTTASGSSGAPNSYLIKKTVTSSADYIAQDMWILEEYTGSDIWGIKLIPDSEWLSGSIVEGDEGILDVISWDSSINVNTTIAEIDTETPYRGHLEHNYSNDNYTLTANNIGKLRIKATVKNSWTGTVSFSVNFNFWVIPEEGTYNIQNIGTGRYIDIKYNSTLPGATIQQYDYLIYESEEWIIEHASEGGGYIKFRSALSDLYLSVDPSNTTAIKQYEDGTDYSLWRLDRTTTGNLTITCKATASSGNVLSVPLDQNANNTPLTQISYTDNLNYKDEWKLKATERNAIIIIPGILGSELYIGNYNPYFEYDMPLFSEDTISELNLYQSGFALGDFLSADTLGKIKNISSAFELYNAWSDSMSCNENGTSKYEINVKEYRSEEPSTTNNRNCGTGNAYSALYDKLVDEYGDRYYIDLFSYDWRLSNADSAEKLKSYIEYHFYDSVILVAHSMGGLVASGYLGMGVEQRNKVEQVYYLSSPLLGTPAVANIWYNEDISFVAPEIASYFKISLNTFNTIYNLATGLGNPLQNLINNYVSVYELFPSEYYFELTGNSYISRSFNALLPGGIGDDFVECNTYALSKDVLDSYFPNFDLALMSQAENFHDTTFIGNNHISNRVDAFYCHSKCTDEERKTISHVNLYQIATDILVTGLEVDGKTINGDKLVLTSSATLADAYPLKCIYKTGIEYDHMTFVTDPNVIDEWIPNIP